MADEMRPYVIRQGDYLTRLAHRMGFSADEVWSKPENEELRRARSDYDMLAPGDIVYLPVARRRGLAFTPRTHNKYIAVVPKVKVALQFMKDGEALANEPYLLSGLGGEVPVEGVTDEQGGIALEVSVLVRELDVLFHERGHLRYNVRLGDMDPETTASGVRARLRHLGFYGWVEDADDLSEVDKELKDRRAIAAFQASQGLPVTGEADAKTTRALVESHGS